MTQTPYGEVDIVAKLLAGHADIAEAIVVRDGTRSAAAVVPQAFCTAVDIRDDLWDAVPAEQLPDLVVVVPELPRDASGEIRTDELVRTAAEDPGACGFAAPGTPTEQALATIWRDLLGRRHVATQDNFFDLGGDSITSTLLLDLVNERFAVNMSFEALLAAASLAAVAEAVDAASSGVE